MQLYDLLECSDAVIAETCDVCIIGAGAAGIYLGTQLALKGTSVIILEAGGRVCSDGDSLGLKPQFVGQAYPGATLGRAFGLGGTTSRWGGLLVPHTASDVREISRNGFDPWRHIVDTVAQYSHCVLSNLGFRGDIGFRTLPWSELTTISDMSRHYGIDTMISLYLGLRRKNLAFLLTNSSLQAKKIKIYLNAVAHLWDATTSSIGGSRFRSVHASSIKGTSVRVTARNFVIAAGAIESARILLEVREATKHDVFNPQAAIGNYLADHLSCAVARVDPSNFGLTIQLFGPRFFDGYMRSFRFLEGNPPVGAPRCFAHFVFHIDNAAYRLAKQVVLALQSRRWPHFTVKEIMAAMAGFFSFAHSRYLQSRLYIPKDTLIHLQIDIEQQPIRSNAISLTDQKDQFRRRIAKIEWSVGTVDYTNITDAAKRFISRWPGAKAGLPKLLPIIIDGNTPKPHDAYHPVGTCKLGVDNEAVVSPQLRVLGSVNLWILSTGVLPSAGTANPTFTMLCLGEALVDHLASFTQQA